MTAAAARRADADQAGFTLLELLAVLMVLGLVMIAVGGGVRFANRGFDRAAATATELSSYSLAADLLRRRGERLFPLSVGWGADSQFVFLGEADRLAGPILSTPTESQTPGPPLRYVLFQIEALEGGGSRLILREHRLVTDPGLRVIEPADHAVNLYESAAAMRFSYHDGARWLDRWTAPRDLPRLIRLSFTDASGRATRPALILRPRLDGDRGCASDAALPCRDRP
jgi:prepilin-type N-terminal cleavage/methylation domain-containing protein